MQLFSKFYDLSYSCGYFSHKKRFLAISEMSKNLPFLMNMSKIGWGIEEGSVSGNGRDGFLSK